MENLKQHFIELCQQYVDIFCIKHGLTFASWFENHVGTDAYFKNGMVYSFRDIQLDINTDQPKERIKEWQMFCINYPHISTDYFTYLLYNKY